MTTTPKTLTNNTHPEDRCCDRCGAALGHVPSVLILDRLLDAVAYCEASKVAPLEVRATQAGAVEIVVDLADFKRLTRGEKAHGVSMVERLGIPHLSTTDLFFTLMAALPG